MYMLDICDDLGPILSFLKHGIIPLVQIGIPIVLIVLGMVDLGRAVVASDDKKVKEAQSMLIKRIIYAVVIFFVVTIVTLVFNLFANTGNDDLGADSWYDCWEGA